MLYTVEVDYTECDSFCCEDSVEDIALVWRDKHAAEKALAEIKEHYAMYMLEEQSNTPAERDKVFQLAREKPWFWSGADLELSPPNDFWTYGMLLENDQGDRQQIQTQWVGYFNSLNGARVIKTNGDLVIG